MNTWAQGFITSSRVVFESTSESMKYSINVKPLIKLAQICFPEGPDVIGR